MDRSCIDTIVNKSKQMQKDGTGHKKAEIIVWYQDHEYGIIPFLYVIRQLQSVRQGE